MLFYEEPELTDKLQHALVLGRAIEEALDYPDGHIVRELARAVSDDDTKFNIPNKQHLIHKRGVDNFSLGEWVNITFTWDSTPQGHTFWQDLKERLCKRDRRHGGPELAGVVHPADPLADGVPFDEPLPAWDDAPAPAPPPDADRIRFRPRPAADPIEDQLMQQFDAMHRRMAELE